ncbi:MFS superfamily [Lentinula aff. lateritia]|uniref:MFS superfamily n=1 Tax=Lentinula aff. lateritia TaxID=2804960 RepID=A0ACC1TPB8_9AGAR|nr:MFS superfamily [Lentinula aff. lateritia]
MEEQSHNTHNTPPHPQSSKEFCFVPVPQWLIFDSNKPMTLSIWMNIALGLGATFTVANLYYCQPMLGINSFLAVIPTLIQSGYAVGVLFISPLGDLVQRRQLVLGLITCTTATTIGLAVTTSFTAFAVLNFLIGIFSVIPQILVPLAADLAPVDRKAGAIAIIWSSLMMGILVARLLAGIVVEFASLHVVYYMAIGIQACVLGGAYLIIPNYPAKDAEGSYSEILRTMGHLAITEPLLIMNTISIFLSTACFAGFWISLTFLLESPYSYSTLDIGLFALLGILGVTMAPFFGRMIDRIFPWYSILGSLCLLLLFQAVLVIGAGLNITTVIIAALGLDLFRTTVQVSLTASSFSLNTSARSRINAVMAVAMPLGQVMGTSASSRIFLRYGWRSCYGLALAWTVLQVFLLLARGPHCPPSKWIGYEGGWRIRKAPINDISTGSNLHAEDPEGK